MRLRPLRSKFPNLKISKIHFLINFSSLSFANLIFWGPVSCNQSQSQTLFFEMRFETFFRESKFSTISSQNLTF